LAKTLKLRKAGSSRFIETVETQGSPLVAKRQYSRWEEVEERLRELGLEADEIERLKSALDSEADAVLIRLPYHPGDTVSTI